MQKLKFPFATHLNFLDQELTNDGKPYGPTRYKELVKECYLVSKCINTSYNDVLKLTPTERNYILEFLNEEAQQRKEIIEKQKAERAAKAANR